jgi:hypothetical protein
MVKIQNGKPGGFSKKILAMKTKCKKDDPKVPLDPKYKCSKCDRKSKKKKKLCKPKKIKKTDKE